MSVPVMLTNRSVNYSSRLPIIFISFFFLFGFQLIYPMKISQGVLDLFTEAMSFTIH